MRYLKGFHADTHAAASPALRPMLHGKALWGVAIREELAQFRSEGWFLSPEVVIDEDSTTVVRRLAQELEPEWRATIFPLGVNRLTALFLMVIKAGGEELMKHVEDSASLALAAELLPEVAERLTSTSGRALDGVVLSGCGLGDPSGWLEDAGPAQQDGVAFLTNLEELPEPEPERTLVCTPSAFKSAHSSAGQVAFGWSYATHAPKDLALVVRHVFAGSEREAWDEARQRLWGVHEDGGPDARL
jgi:hypothetical protein